ncbi:MAG TPA: HipA domain-containing protein [Polyangiaceae bacterium]|nr:HipA domain-containing protein [Polyangiaceae bacterium]
MSLDGEHVGIIEETENGSLSYWVGNGDMHLKNFSLLRGEDGNYRLSPAYDLLSTRLVIANDALALSVAGKKKNVKRRHWLELAERCDLPERVAGGVLVSIAGTLGDALEMIARSLLPAAMKKTYAALVERRSGELTA